MNAAAPPTTDATRLLALADALLLISEGLRIDVRPGPRDVLPGEADLAELAARARLPRSVADALARSFAGGSGEDRGARSADRARLFDGPTVCPPNETAWVRRDKGHLLGDIAGFYLAFGFRVAGGAGEKADHVVAELQFVAVLLAMIARAAEAGDSEHEDVARKALAAFAADHLGAWIERFCERLAATAACEAHRALALALVGVWTCTLDAASVDVPDDAIVDDLPPAEDGTPYECDGCL